MKRCEGRGGQRQLALEKEIRQKEIAEEKDNLEGIERQVEDKLQQLQDEGDTIRLQMEERIIEAEGVIDDS